MGLGRSDKLQSLTQTCIKPTQNGKCIVGTLLVLGRPRATRTHKTHHGPDLGEATTFPLIVYSAPLHGGHIQMAFCLRLPSESPKIPTTGTPVTLRAHNFLYKPLITMSFKAQLQPLSRAFQQYVTRCLHARRLGRFLTFSGRESNCQFDSRPFFWP